MRAILEVCAVDDPRCDDTADLLGDQLDLILIGAAVVAVIVVVTMLIERELRRRAQRAAERERAARPDA